MARKLQNWRGASDDTSIPPRVKLRVLERHGRSCALCGGRNTRVWEFDHIVALINGGEHCEENLQPLCTACHRSKTLVDLATKSKVARTAKKHLGLTEKKPWSRYRKKMDGTVIDRQTGQILKPGRNT